MSLLAKSTKTTVIPCLRYRNTAVAIDWLCSAFGFKKMAVYANEDGTIAHAQLAFGNGMIMVGPVANAASVWGRLITQPDEIEGAGTQAVYLVVTDADAIYEQARAFGAQIVIDIKDEDYGGRGFTCRDIEKHLWSFGTYDPWKSE